MFLKSLDILDIKFYLFNKRNFVVFIYTRGGDSRARSVKEWEKAESEPRRRALE